MPVLETLCAIIDCSRGFSLLCFSLFFFYWAFITAVLGLIRHQFCTVCIEAMDTTLPVRYILYAGYHCVNKKIKHLCQQPTYALYSFSFFFLLVEGGDICNRRGCGPCPLHASSPRAVLKQHKREPAMSRCHCRACLQKGPNQQTNLILKALAKSRRAK